MQSSCSLQNILEKSLKIVAIYNVIEIRINMLVLALAYFQSWMLNLVVRIAICRSRRDGVSKSELGSYS